MNDAGTAYEVAGTTTNNISVTAAAVYLGAAQGDTATDFDGRLDEVVVFKDILTTEADEIAAQTYDGPEGGISAVSIFEGNGGIFK